MIVIVRARWLVCAAVCLAVVVATPFAVSHYEGRQTVAAQSGNWGLGFHTEGQPPTGNVSAEKLAEYRAFYVGDTSTEQGRVLYLTFDAGFENGNTAPILDALKKHKAPATFFLVKHYLDTAPELVQRMVAEGHTIGNHTATHPDMSKIADQSSFEAELKGLENAYRELMGQEMTKWYRPPQGKYSEQNLKMANELGYNTFFWSLAYVDWVVDRQPSREEALQKLTSRVHPGAIVLLHSTSATNAQILDELLCKWESMGYRFASLSELI